MSRILVCGLESMASVGGPNLERLKAWMTCTLLSRATLTSRSTPMRANVVSVISGPCAERRAGHAPLPRGSLLPCRMPPLQAATLAWSTAPASSAHKTTTPCFTPTVGHPPSFKLTLGSRVSPGSTPEPEGLALSSPPLEACAGCDEACCAKKVSHSTISLGRSRSSVPTTSMCRMAESTGSGSGSGSCSRGKMYLATCGGGGPRNGLDTAAQPDARLRREPPGAGPLLGIAEAVAVPGVVRAAPGGAGMGGAAHHSLKGLLHRGRGAQLGAQARHGQHEVRHGQARGRPRVQRAQQDLAGPKRTGAVRR